MPKKQRTKPSVLVTKGGMVLLRSKRLDVCDFFRIALMVAVTLEARAGERPWFGELLRFYLASVGLTLQQVAGEEAVATLRAWKRARARAAARLAKED